METMTFNKQFTADGSVFSTTNNLGNWDVPFKKLLDFNYSIGNINGSRSVWVSSNSWISGEGATDPTTTSAGTVITLLTWAGNAQYDVSCTAFGLWK